MAQHNKKLCLGHLPLSEDVAIWQAKGSEKVPGLCRLQPEPSRGSGDFS